jgi:hypothetical protein
MASFSSHFTFPVFPVCSKMAHLRSAHLYFLLPATGPLRAPFQVLSSPYSYQLFPLLSLLFKTKNEVSMFLQITGEILLDYNVSHPLVLWNSTIPYAQNIPIKKNNVNGPSSSDDYQNETEI